MDKKSLWKNTKWWLGALFWPFEWSLRGILKKGIIFVAAWRLLQPASVMLFPRAEDVLKEAGLSNPSLVQELAPGQKIYVRKDNLLGRISATLDDGPWLVPFEIWEQYRERRTLGAFSRGLSFPFNNVCVLYLREDMVKSALDNVYSSQESYQQFLLHEIRHCGEPNRQLRDPLYKEGDADYEAMRIIVRENNTPGYQNSFMLDRGGSNGFDESHNDALYLDARIRGVPVPPAADIIVANNTARAINRAMFSSIMSCVSQGKHCDYAPPVDALTPLAARRVELFRQAWDEAIRLMRKNQPAKLRMLHPPQPATPIPR